MIREYCDGCNEEILHGNNKVKSTIKASIKINGDNYIAVEVKLGTICSPEGKGHKISVWEGLGHLCKICAVRAVLFAADGCAMGRLDGYLAEKPVMSPVPKWVTVTVAPESERE